MSHRWTNLATDLVQLVTLLPAFVRLGVIPVVRSRLGLPVSLPDLGKRIRVFLDGGGLIYRKLGQYLAMRTDLLPAPICAELDRLFDRVSPMPFALVERVVEEELGQPWRVHFQSLEPEPIGSASVAQVHRAVAHDGTVLAVKVQRAGIREPFESGVRVFRWIARLADELRLAGQLSLQEMFEEFAAFTAGELNFENEGRSATLLRDEMSRRWLRPAGVLGPDHIADIDPGVHRRYHVLDVLPVE